ncbi:MAG: transcriptional regulator [Burkholderiales bacterium PBB3]|nr:MAG: transcriptional regulator [Burkholderiales bacterium PBB3]
MDEKDVIRALAALAQQSRLQIFRQLVVAGPDGMTPTRLSEALGLPGTALSFHLKELTHANLITQERDGRNLIYRADFASMNSVLAYLTAHCCEGTACEVTTPAACTAC